MDKGLSILIGLIIYCLPSFGQLTVKQVKFDSWFGYHLNDKAETAYCLLGTGYFRAPRADNTDSLITEWISQHPNALVIPVYTSGPRMTDSKDSKMIYSWVVDKSDTLNIALVRQGCIPGGTMQRPKTWEEMKKKDRELYYDNKRPNETVHVDKKSYKLFLDKVIKAESDAKTKKLGIWTDEKK